MLQFSQVIQGVDSHTAGEPTRIVTGGLPPIPGATMAEKRAALQRDFDHLRRALVLEPRGHDAIVLAYLLPPCTPGAHLGVVFANDAGYLGMCGHGAIGVATVAVATGMVKAQEPETEVVLDTPAGAVTCRVAVQGGKVRAALVREGVRGRHPERDADEVVDHVKLFEAIDGVEPGSRALTLCPGAAYDRSPCGTGTSAKLAVLHGKGEIEAGQWFRSESVLKTAFRARIVGETKVGPFAAIVPEIEGSAWITGFPAFVIDPSDPCRFGI